MSGPRNEWEREQRRREWQSYRDEAKPKSSKLEQARQLLSAIQEQLECPSRNTTMTSHRRDGSVIISHDLRERVREWLKE